MLFSVFSWIVVQFFSSLLEHDGYALTRRLVPPPSSPIYSSWLIVERRSPLTSDPRRANHMPEVNAVSLPECKAAELLQASWLLALMPSAITGKC